MLYHPYSYRITIDKNQIALQRTYVLIYLVYFSLKYCIKHRSSRFNTLLKADVYQIIQSKLILRSHYRSRRKGLYLNKKHEFNQYTKGGHFCVAHMSLKLGRITTLCCLIGYI